MTSDTKEVFSWSAMDSGGPEPERTVLIVDDDPSFVRLLEKVLGRSGYRTSRATTGTEAIRRLRECPVELVLLDLHLPDLRGRALITELQAAGMRRFVVITGQGDERAAVDVMKEGATDYLVKDRELLDLVPARVGQAFVQIEHERRLAATEGALRREHALMTAILDTTGALIVVLDPEGRIVEFNRACEILTGYSLDEVRGRRVWDFLLLPEERSGVMGTFNQILSGRFANQAENHWLGRDGRRHLIAWSNTLIRDGDRITHVVGTGLDITTQRELESQVLRAVEEEQRRIGQDLHDDLGQQLTGIEFMTRALERRLQDRHLREAEAAAELARLTRDALARTRELARGLCPLAVEADGLVTALRSLAHQVTERFSIACEVRVDEAVRVDNATAATHLFRIAQEAVTNAVRHGSPTRITIALNQTDHRIVLAIGDNGRGIAPETDVARGIGLRVMQYRAGMIGGSLAIERGRDGGTTVVCTVYR